MNFDALLDELAERVAAKVLAKLSQPVDHYSARNPPPGKSKAWAQRNLSSIPGAKKIGRDWVVSVEAFEAWRSEKDTERARNSAKDSRRIANDVTPDIETLVQQGLSEAGYRSIRKTG